MRPLELYKSDTLAACAGSGFDNVTLMAVNYLRLVALDCRSAARTDFYQACAVLAQDKTAARRAYAETLVKCLPQALGARPVFYAPGEGEYSFDEAWLMRLIQSATGQDLDSFAFLIKSRVPPVAQRNLAFLVHAMADSFYQD